VPHDFPLLVVRHADRFPHFNEVIIEWGLVHVPEVVRLFDLRLLPVEDRRDWLLLVPWLQDPVQAWSQEAYEQALALQEDFDRRGRPVVNRVELLTNASKTEGARLMTQAGLRTPRTVAITDPAEFRETLCGLEPPLFVREDWGHQTKAVRADTVEEARALPVEDYERPVVTQFVETADEDGVYRKFRFLAAGETGVPYNLQMSYEWEVRGGSQLPWEAKEAEDLAYVSRPDPNEQRFQAARELLGLDVVAFDYAYDRDGEAVVWEANPYPFLHFPVNTFKDRHRSKHRAIAAILRLYLDRAGLAVPEQVEMTLRDD
jgi:hypothetical protein